jgi:hypothetical protein
MHHIGPSPPPWIVSPSRNRMARYGRTWSSHQTQPPMSCFASLRRTSRWRLLDVESRALGHIAGLEQPGSRLRRNPTSVQILPRPCSARTAPCRWPADRRAASGSRSLRVSSQLRTLWKSKLRGNAGSPSLSSGQCSEYLGGRDCDARMTRTIPVREIRARSTVRRQRRAQSAALREAHGNVGTERSAVRASSASSRSNAHIRTSPAQHCGRVASTRHRHRMRPAGSFEPDRNRRRSFGTGLPAQRVTRLQDQIAVVQRDRGRICPTRKTRRCRKARSRSCRRRVNTAGFRSCISRRRAAVTCSEIYLGMRMARPNVGTHCLGGEGDDAQSLARRYSPVFGSLTSVPIVPLAVCFSVRRIWPSRCASLTKER